MTYARFGLFVNGAWQPARSGRTLPVLSPVTEQSLGDCPAAGPEDTARLIQSQNLRHWQS